MKAPVLDSQRLYYVPLSSAHLSQTYVNWLNDKEVCKYIVTAGNTSLFLLEEFLNGVEKDPILFWAIHLKESGKHIGNIKIDPIVEKHGLCEYGILMGDSSEWGKGYGKEASITIINYCFNILHLRKMTLGVVEDNTNAVKLYKSLGFTVEGVYKQHELYDGKYCDTLRMALFNPAIIPV